MVLSDRRAVSRSSGPIAEQDAGLPCRRPGAAAVPGRRRLRQRPAGLSRRQGPAAAATPASAPPRRTASRSTRSSAKCSPAAIPATGPGDRVVGWASGFDGLMERVVTDGNGLAAYDSALSPALAVGLQPLACVLYAVEQLPDLDGPPRRGHRSGLDRPAVLLCGQGGGARPRHRRRPGRPRRDRARRSASTPWCAPPATGGSVTSTPDDRPDVVIEAVGHQVATLSHAIEAAAPGGTVFYFGVPDDDSYPISMRTMLRNNLTLKSGVTLDRRRVLELADEFAREHPESAGRATSPTPSASTRCRPRSNWPADRFRSASRSRSSDERRRADCSSPRREGPDLGRLGDRARPSSVRRNSPRPATTTSDSTRSTAISTTPTSRCMLRRLEHVPDRHRGAAAHRRSGTDRPGARRRRRRRHHRDDRIGRTGGRARSPPPAIRPPACAASGRCGPASATTPPALESRVERVRDDRNRAAACRRRRDLRGARADRRLRRAGRSGDLDGRRPGRA